MGSDGVASCAIFINSSRDGPIPRVGSAMLASMAWPCQETERVSAWAETANALVNATVKQTDNPRMRLLRRTETNLPAGRGYFGHPLDT